MTHQITITNTSNWTGDDVIISDRHKLKPGESCVVVVSTNTTTVIHADGVVNPHIKHEPIKNVEPD